jgi:YVTN family beta-propeller protein
VLAPGAPAGSTVVLLDTARGAITGMVETGTDSKPTGITIAPDGLEAYVTNYATSTISVIDLASARLVLDIAVPRQPEEIAISADGTHLLVASDAGTASIVAVRERRVLSTIETGGNDPSGVALSPDGRTGYVTNSFTNPTLGEDGTLTVLDLSNPAEPRIVDTIVEGVGPTPYDVQITHDGLIALVTNLNVIFTPLTIGPGSLSLIDLTSATPETTIVPLGTAPIHVSLAPLGDVALAGNGLAQTISIVDVAAATVVGEVDLGTSIGPADIAIQP